MSNTNANQTHPVVAPAPDIAVGRSDERVGAPDDPRATQFADDQAEAERQAREEAERLAREEAERKAQAQQPRKKRQARGAPVPEGSTLDLLWGAGTIAKELGVSRRVAFYMLENGQLPAKQIGGWVNDDGKLVGGRWVITRRALHQHFGG